MSEDSVLHSVLENARRELLDLTARNPLLNTTRSSTRSSRLEIVDEVSGEVFRHLVAEGKAMSFLPVREEEQTEGNGDEDQGLLFQPEDDELDKAVLQRDTSTTSYKHVSRPTDFRSGC